MLTVGEENVPPDLRLDAATRIVSRKLVVGAPARQGIRLDERKGIGQAARQREGGHMGKWLTAAIMRSCSDGSIDTIWQQGLARTEPQPWPPRLWCAHSAQETHPSREDVQSAAPHPHAQPPHGVAAHETSTGNAASASSTIDCLTLPTSMDRRRGR